jgi:hypothetical protein
MIQQANPIMPLVERLGREALEKRLWGRFRANGADACWGSGKHHRMMCIDGFNVTAHRLAWVLANGVEIPEGLLVCHRCDNPPCRNPAHLFIGTVRDNALDMVSKGRGNHVSVLSPETVRQIRASTTGPRQLARELGVSRYTIHDVRRRRSWAHIQ